MVIPGQIQTIIGGVVVYKETLSAENHGSTCLINSFEQLIQATHLSNSLNYWLKQEVKVSGWTAVLEREIGLGYSFGLEASRNRRDQFRHSSVEWPHWFCLYTTVLCYNTGSFEVTWLSIQRAERIHVYLLVPRTLTRSASQKCQLDQKLFRECL